MNEIVRRETYSNPFRPLRCRSLLCRRTSSAWGCTSCRRRSGSDVPGSRGNRARRKSRGSRRRRRTRDAIGRCYAFQRRNLESFKSEFLDLVKILI
jgi:hypothetical protein